MSKQGFVPGFSLAFRFALRELRGGLRGFYIFLGCIALGVAAIGGVNSVAQSITAGVEKEGQAILGGDLSFALVQREANTEQLEYLNSLGDVTKLITMRAMARLPDGSDQTLVELKAVDDKYPHYGELRAGNDVVGGSQIDGEVAYAEPLLFDRLGLKEGDLLEVGSTRFKLKARIDTEPDKVGDNVGFGPRLMVSLEGLERTGLIQPGSLVRYHYKIKLPEPSRYM